MQALADNRLFGEKQTPALAGGFRQSNLTHFFFVQPAGFG
jgi:hypothetical protein